MLAYEAGYRRQFADRVSIDVAGYVNRYDDLRTPGGRCPAAPVVLANMMNGRTRGVETTAVGADSARAGRCTRSHALSLEGADASMPAAAT